MPTPDGRSTHLTEGERLALRLSARGLVVAEVAEAMCASPDTVREWVASAIEKLGARSKLEAVLIAVMRDELDPTP